MQDTGFGFLWVSLVPSLKFPLLTALTKQGETTQCQHSRHGTQRSPQQRCRRHEHSHPEADTQTHRMKCKGEKRRKQEEQSTLQRCASMVREEERGDEWRDTRDIEWHVCDALSETNSARQTEQKGEREVEREADIDRREVIKGEGLRWLATPPQ